MTLSWINENETYYLEYARIFKTMPASIGVEELNTGEEMFIPRSHIVDPYEGDGLEETDRPGQMEVTLWIAKKKGLA